MKSGTFLTVINCMDGRVQLPVQNWLMGQKMADFFDTITEPGADFVLSNGSDDLIQHIYQEVMISVSLHRSNSILLVGHHDCAANPVDQEQHIHHILKGIRKIQAWDLGVRTYGLWLGENWRVECIYDSEK